MKKYIIGNISRLQNEKGQDELIKAIHDLPFAVELWIIGKGDDENLKSLVSNLGLSQQVKFFGFVSDHKNQILLSQMNLFVFPTRWELEGFGIVPLEAMACGVPVVASNLNVVREVLGKAALYVKPNARGIATGISKMYYDPILSKKYIDLGKERVKVYNITNIMNAYQKII